MDLLQRLVVRSDRILIVQMPAFQRRMPGRVLKVGQMQKPGLVEKVDQMQMFDLVGKLARKQMALLALMSAQMQTFDLGGKLAQRLKFGLVGKLARKQMALLALMSVQMQTLILAQKAVQRQMWSPVLKADQTPTAGPKSSVDPTQGHLQMQTVFQRQNLLLEQTSDRMHPQA
jgi:hypothetical protein